MGMHSFFSYFSKLPSWGGTPPKSYSIPYSFDTLRTGLDNVHYDVFLSPFFSQAIGKIAFQFIVKNSDSEKFLDSDTVSSWVKERDKFQHLCTELLAMAVNKASGEDCGVQLDYLIQTIVVKTLLSEIRGQFETLIEKFNGIVWEKETSFSQDLRAVAQIKEKTASLRQQRKAIIYNTSKELFGYLLEVQQKNIIPLRRKYFGDDSLLPGEFFANPLIYQGSRLEDSSDDSLMIEEYVLLSRRRAEPNTYERILSLLTQLIGKIELDSAGAIDPLEQKHEEQYPDGTESENTGSEGKQQRDDWLKQTDTIDILFNYFQTEGMNNAGAYKNTAGNDPLEQQRRQEAQKKFLAYCYKEFEKKGLVEIIAASCEVKALYKEYCPPLVPQQILQFWVTPKASHDIEAQLQRAYKIYGHSLSLESLKSVIKRLAKLTEVEKQQRLIEFMKGFVRYHRDLGNFNILRTAMDRVRLISDIKSYDLSKANNTLYEFLLPQEQESVVDEKPVQNHVAIKVELRGLADINRFFSVKGLHAASYFSQNLFDPISRVVSGYSAFKVEVGQSAIVLVLIERQGGRGKTSDISRACGLAMQLMTVIQCFNAENAKKQLPLLEVGVGVGYEDGPPVFLYDGESKITISKAIDDAAQLSACSRPLQGHFDKNKGPYNIYLTPVVGDTAATGDTALRFRCNNYNGIGLSRSGFSKLADEIDLEVFVCDLPEFEKESSTLYKGKLAGEEGKTPLLIIREAQTPEIDAEKIYEICINAELYEFAANIT